MLYIKYYLFMYLFICIALWVVPRPLYLVHKACGDPVRFLNIIDLQITCMLPCLKKKHNMVPDVGSSFG